VPRCGSQPRGCAAGKATAVGLTSLVLHARVFGPRRLVCRFKCHKKCHDKSPQCNGSAQASLLTLPD